VERDARWFVGVPGYPTLGDQPMKIRAMRLSVLALSLAGICASGAALAENDRTVDPSQQAPGTLVAQNQSRQFVVYFALGEAVLDTAAQETIAAAAQEYQRTGSARVVVRGHTDTSGSASFNQALSERRELAVTDALISQGVPADAISGVAVGEADLAVPTEDGVREAANRRVEINVEQIAPPPEPAPPPPEPAPAPQVVTTPEPQEPEFERGLFGIGLFYGYNLEDENGGDSQLGGLNLSLDYAVTRWLGVGLEQAGFYHFDTRNDGFGGRTAASLDLRFMGEVAPHFGGNIGYLYGSGFDDDFFAGPEIGVAAGPFLAKVAYDIPFNRDLDEGIIAATVGFGLRF
jgi:outer membrane protein OmpA-like peptidoglycan-associated protein